MLKLLPAIACTSKRGCFDYTNNSEWNCSLGGYTGLEIKLSTCSLLMHAEGKEGQKPPYTLPLTATCY